MTSTPAPTSTGLPTGLLARAVGKAPSVHNSQPWELEVRDGSVDILQRAHTDLPIHDPEGRDRMMSCGAALAHLELALRGLGHEVTLDIPDSGDIVATALIGGFAPPSLAELGLCRAIGWRRSYRRKFRAVPLSDSLHARVVAAGSCRGVRVSEPGNIEGLAAMLGQATLIFRQDHAYQRELSIRTSHTFGDYATDRIPGTALSPEALPVAGLIRGDTPVPDDTVLAARLAAENIVVLCTDGDTRAEHVAAGYALERMWLTATAQGLLGSVITQPLHLTGFRERLADRVGLPGLPQAIFRFGFPAVSVPRSPRRAPGGLFHHETGGAIR
jgi:hypothetical protein